MERYTDQTSTDDGVVAWNITSRVVRTDGRYTVTVERASLPNTHGYGARPEHAGRTRARARQYVRSVLGTGYDVEGAARTSYGRREDGYPARWSTYDVTAL